MVINTASWDVHALTARLWQPKHRLTLLAGMVIVFSIMLRVALSVAGWPGTDSDDATMGLMARHILWRGEHPIFFYGQAYMGTIEAYLGAGMFWLFGASDQALHFGLVILFATFLVLLWWLMHQAHGPVWAVISLALLSVGSDDILYHQLAAYGGYLETLVFGTAQIAIALWLLRQREATPQRRCAAFGLWGLAVGLGIWSDPLVLPFVVVSALALGWLCWREVRGRAGAIALICFCVGIAPWPIYVLSSGSAAAATSFLPHSSAPTSAVPTATTAPPLWQTATTQIIGTAVVSIPANLGASAVCPLGENDWPPENWTAPTTRVCVAARFGLGATFLLGMLLAIILEGRMVWRLQPMAKTSADHERLARAVGRLMALGAPMLTIILFSLSSAAAKNPWIFSRYLISMAVALPVMLATLWEHAANHRRTLGRAAVGTATVGLFILNSWGSVVTFSEAPMRQAATQHEQTLITYLIQHHETAFYSIFWTCYQEAFLSNEQLACSVVDVNDVVLPNRYPPYDTLVRSAPTMTFVFPLDRVQATNFPQMASVHGWTYTSTVVARSYVVFQVVKTDG